MNARAASLAMEFPQLQLPLVQRAARRKGGPGSRGPRAGAARRCPGTTAASALHASNRSRRRRERTHDTAGSHVAACA